MKPHEQRVEKADLDAKIARIDAFAVGDVYPMLPDRQRALLAEQRHYMGLYSRVLGVRIAEFEFEPEPEAPPQQGEP